jgi:hypothetical protein
MLREQSRQPQATQWAMQRMTMIANELPATNANA